MNKLDQAMLKRTYGKYIISRYISSKSNQRKIAECYQILKIPLNSNQDVVREAFLQLAKKYHPDSGSSDADLEKFINVEDAFRTLTKHNTGASSKEEVEKVIYDIKHTAPQHRQYLSYEGYGQGNPFQRQRQYIQARAQKAATNVMEHRAAKAVASDNTLMKKGEYGKKHDIKTKYGFDRLVEDLIQESMSKGEFENLSGNGKPLKNQNTNPYVDFTTHKLNEVLINNGFTPEWITMAKEIDEDVKQLRNIICKERSHLGPYPLTGDDILKWEKIYQSNKELAGSINTKINTYNLIVPLINKQKFHVEFDKMCTEILKDGLHSVAEVDNTQLNVKRNEIESQQTEDLFSVFFKALSELLSFNKDKKI